MNFVSLLKKVIPVMAIFVVTLGILNMGSYDPYDELSVLVPASVQATSSFGGVSGFDIPSLTIPSLNEPDANFMKSLEHAEKIVKRNAKNLLDTSKKSRQYVHPDLYSGLEDANTVGTQRTVVKTGKDKSGRKVVQYSNGDIEYAE